MLSLSGYKLAFDDEFSGTRLDTAKWSTQFPFNPTDHLSNEMQRYQNVGAAHDPFSEAGGVLTITASPAPDLGAGMYASGRIGSEKAAFSFTAGTYIEARMMLPAGQNTGMWPAFWAAAKDTWWPPEMDVMEKVSSTSSGLGPNAFTYGEVTGDSSGAFGTYINTSADLTNSYHTYGTMWTLDGTVIEYFDGQELARGKAPSDWLAHPMYVEANLAVGGTTAPANWAGPADGLSHQLKIDYIRGFSVNQAAVAPQALSSPDGGGADFHGATVGSDTIVIALSADLWKGAPQFLFKVDGVQQGAPIAVSALHAQGQTQEFTFTGAFGPGTHDIGVTFINDAWGGTKATDRNLYVDKLTFDGISNTTDHAALYSNGTTHFYAHQ